MRRYSELTSIRAGIGLAMFVLGAAQAAASPYYSVQDLGTVSATQAQGGGAGDLIGIDQSGNVRFYPNGGLNFGNSATGPVPAGDQSYYSVVQTSENGLYSIGNAWNPSGQHFDSYLVTGGNVILISALAASPAIQASYPMAVNNSGQVVGFANVVDSTQTSIAASGPFIYTPGHGSTFISTSGGIAYGINNLGQVVGAIPFQAPTSAALHAFLWTNNGQPPTDLNALIDSSKWTLTTATGINDAGQIVTYGTDPSGQYHALLLTPIDPSASIPSAPSSPGNPAPVPEPSNLIFMGLVLTGFGTRRLIRHAARHRAANGRKLCG